MDLIYEGITTLRSFSALIAARRQNGPDLRRDYDMINLLTSLQGRVRMDLIYEGITTGRCRKWFVRHNKGVRMDLIYEGITTRGFLE